MPDKLEALGIFLILLPGFCSAYVIQHLCVRRKQSDLDKVVEALLFSLLLYLATLPLFGFVLPLSWHPATTPQGTVYTIAIHYKHLAVLFLLAIAVGVVYAFNINRDWALRPFRRIGLTDRTARSSVWNDAFLDIPGCYLQVELSDGRTVVGYLRYYADDPDEASIFLEDAAWLTEEDQIPIEGPGILITKEAKVVFISFLRAVDADAGRPRAAAVPSSSKEKV
jgi:hypothetical protein